MFSLFGVKPQLVKEETVTKKEKRIILIFFIRNTPRVGDEREVEPPAT